MPGHRYTHLLLSEFRNILNRNPVAYIPVGLLEWHADHLPLGTDCLRAEAVCDIAAEQLGGIVLPVLYTSCPGYSSFQGTLVFSHDTAVAVALELCAQLEKVGFKAALFLSAHGGPAQRAFLADVATRYQGRMSVLALCLSVASGRGDHAGVFETSDMLAAAPHLVQLQLFAYPENPIVRYEIPPERLWPEESKPWIWRVDVRQQANAAIGEENTRRIVAYCRRWLAERGLPLKQEASAP
jgi:creatinine amidohydrolase